MKAAFLLAALIAGLLAATVAAAAPSDSKGVLTFGEVMAGLQRAWRQDCSAGPIDVKVTVVFQIDGAGRLVGAPQASSESQGPMAEAAMARAVAAIKAAAPFNTLPAMFLGKTYHVVFDGHVACPAGQ